MNSNGICHHNPRWMTRTAKQVLAVFGDLGGPWRAACGRSQS